MQAASFISAEDVKRIYFGNSKHPSVPTIRRWLANGQLPGRKIGKLLFLDVAAFEAEGDLLLEKIIRHESRTA